MVGEDVAHAIGQIGRERKLAAVVGRHLRIGIVRARDVDLVLDDRLVLQHLAGEHEGVARRHGLDEIFLDLAEHAPAARNHLRGARAHQPHLQHVGFHDGADIHAVHLRDARMRDAPGAVLGLLDLGEALVGFQRIAAGRDEIDRGVEIGARQRRVGRRRRHLGIELVGAERHAAGAAEHVLRQHVERAGAQRRRVLRIRRDRRDGGASIPAPRSDWPAPARRARARPCGDWRGRCAAAAARRPSARRH